jgi:hypothetical protein
MNESVRSQRRAIRSVALPSEHGGWGFLLEPVLLGLMAAGSGNGILLALAALGAFLIHQPLKIALKDRLKGQRALRTVWAERFAVGYGLLAFVPFIIILQGVDFTFLIPLLFAIPFIVVQLFYDSRNKSRVLIPELSGAFALAMIAPSIAILGGWLLAPALVLWLLLIARSAPSILYVRARLKLEHDKPADPRPAWAAHLVALFGVVILVFSNAAPRLAVAAMLMLSARAFVGLSKYRKPRRASMIGMQEMIYGFVTAALFAFGYVRGL